MDLGTDGPLGSCKNSVVVHWPFFRFHAIDMVRLYKLDFLVFLYKPFAHKSFVGHFLLNSRSKLFFLALLQYLEIPMRAQESQPCKPGATSQHGACMNIIQTPPYLVYIPPQAALLGTTTTASRSGSQRATLVVHGWHVRASEFQSL